LQGGQVLVCADGDSLLVRLPYSDPMDNRRSCRASVTVDQFGSVVADIRVVHCGVFGHYYRYIDKTETKARRLEPLEKFYSTQFPGMTISNYVSGGDNDSSWYSFHLLAPKVLRRTGTMSMIKPNIFPTREFSAISKSKRIHPVWFGGPELVDTEVSIELPGTWTFDQQLPHMNDSCLNVAHISYRATARKNKLRFTASADNNGELIESADIDHVRTFCKEMRAYNDLTLIINEH